MRKKNFLGAALMMAASVMSFTSCGENEVINQYEEQDQSTAHGKVAVKLVCSPTPSVSYTRASVVANGKQLTDLYILDYNKETGKLLQVLHQTSTAEDFAEPTLNLDYGNHTLKVIATRSSSPALLSADGSLWNLQENTAFVVADDSNVPVVLTSDKTSDSFGASQDVNVGIGKDQTIHIQLDRMVAKLVLENTGTFPADCSTIQLSLDEYKTWNWQSFSVMEAAKNQRISDASQYAGQTGSTISYFLLVPDGDGYTTDISIQMNRKDSDKPYAAFTIPDVCLQRNRITTISGSYYDHEEGFFLTVNDAWDEEQNNVEF